MAIDQLGLYNNALSLIAGQRLLASLVESTEARRLLDASYNLNAVDYCLEVVKPQFATKTVVLSSPTSPVAGLGYTYSHALPADFIAIIGVFSDNKLDQPVARYLKEGSSLICDYATLYLRYTCNTRTMAQWTPTFAKVVATFLAREIAPRLIPQDSQAVDSLFTDVVEVAVTREGERPQEERAAKGTVTLSNSLRHVYNDALLILGLDTITSNTDDSERKSILDRAYDASLVRRLLEDTAWNFALTSTHSYYNPSIEPEFGYRRGHSRPSDLLRLDGIYADEYFQHPIRRYVEEGGVFFVDYDEYYMQYVSTTYLNTPDSWPAYFKRLVAARLAKDAAATLKKFGADVVRADVEFKDRESSAKSDDAMLSPPKILRDGRWIMSRHGRNEGYRGRP